MEHIEERDCCKLDFWKIIFFTDYNLTLNNNKYHINCIHDMMIQIVTTDIIVLNNRNEIDEVLDESIERNAIIYVPVRDLFYQIVS